MGKGSRQRPRQVSEQEWRENWERTFKARWTPVSEINGPDAFTANMTYGLYHTAYVADVDTTKHVPNAAVVWRKVKAVR